MRRSAKASDFLNKFTAGNGAEDEPAPIAVTQAPAVKTDKSESATKAKIGRPQKRPGGSRLGLKHLGGYVDDETAEQFALLKIRLKLGNDELMATAIRAMFKQESAKRKFGD